MTSPVATIGLTYSGSDIQDLDGLFLEITSGLSDSPTVRGEDVTVPYADGQTSRPRRFHERRILLTGFVRGSSRAAFRGTMTSALALFDATAAAADLGATLEDASVATIACRTLSVQTVEVIPGEHAAVSVELLAVEDWTVT